ncbi:L,D-transpeptidase [Cyanobium sp. FGCU-6]|nr:L,D-transpeptidase [Cyanobium sp. FGCU6]
MSSPRTSFLRALIVPLSGGVLLLAGPLGAAELGTTTTAASRSLGAPLTAPPPVPTAAPAPESGTGSAAPATAAVTSTKEIVLELRKRTISLVDNGKVVGSWPVAVGDPATPTPTGTFKVRNKVVNPQYQSTKSGKNNPTIGPQGPLGDRWIGFHTTARDQFGIHGTPTAWEWTVKGREAVSHGCVRMLTPHVRFLFDQVDVGTPVIVKP